VQFHRLGTQGVFTFTILSLDVAQQATHRLDCF
jgi:hypothetical protein